MNKYTDYVTEINLYNKYHLNNNTINTDDYSFEPTEPPYHSTTYYPNIIKTNYPIVSNTPTIYTNNKNNTNNINNINIFTDQNVIIITAFAFVFTFVMAIFLYKFYYLQKRKKKRSNNEKNIEEFGMNVNEIIDF
jgi:cbb3-type cytochrome oxidase subunit 3